MKMTTYFFSSTRCIFIKLLNVSESSIKVKVKSEWTPLVSLITLAVICKQNVCMERWLCNLFKIVNAITLTKTILESPYKLYKVHKKRLSLNDRYNFQRPFNFRLLSTFKLSKLLPHIDQRSETRFFKECT